jgi:hypothetical protein
MQPCDTPGVSKSGRCMRDRKNTYVSPPRSTKPGLMKSPWRLGLVTEREDGEGGCLYLQ